MDFWKTLKKPFFVLAPMENVTDTVYRQIVASAARPDVFFTEFTSINGLTSIGKAKVIDRFQYTEIEHPIVAQIWGKDPQLFKKAIEIVKEYKFDGIDINMGCPDKNVTKHGSGAALIKDMNLASNIINAAIESAEGIPVSVKTRIGYNEIITKEWSSFLLGHKISALTIHGRTKKEMSKVPAHWDEIKKVVDIRNKLKSDILIIGNGDIIDYQDGIEKSKEFGVDGLMIGRGIFNNIWAFEKEKREHTLEESLSLLLRHTQLFKNTWGETKHFDILKKFFKSYVKNFEGASSLREKLMNARNIEEVEKLVQEHIQ